MTAHSRTATRRWVAIFASLLTFATALPASAVAAPPAPAAADQGSWQAERTVPADNCPKPGRPDQDHMCSVGPTYLIPGLTDVNGWDDVPTADGSSRWRTRVSIHGPGTCHARSRGGQAAEASTGNSLESYGGLLIW